MKKFMKKMLSAITVAAMAFTMVAVPTTKAEAAENTVKVVVKGGKVDTFTGANIWAWSGSNNFTGGKWPGAEMTKTTDGYEYTLTISDTIQSFDFLINDTANNDSKTSDTTGIGTEYKVVTITFDDYGNVVGDYVYSGDKNTVADLDEGKTAKDIEVNVKLEGDFSSIDLTKLCVYKWNDGFEGSMATGYPGTELTLKDGIYNAIIKVETSVTGIGMLINNGSDEFKTGDITANDLSTGKLYITVNADKTAEIATVKPTTWITTDDDTTGNGTNTDNTNKNPSTNTGDLEDDVVIITEEEIKEVADSVKVEGMDDKLVVSVVPSDSADLKVIASSTADELKDVKYVALDLKFESGKQPAEGTKITVSVSKLAALKDVEYVSVYRVDEDALELVEVAKITDGNLTFEPDHFSTYVFAEANEAEYNEYVNNQEAGVSLPIVALIAVAALAGGCVVFSSKRKHA